MNVSLHDTVDRPEPSRWRRSVLAIVTIVVPIVAIGGCSEGFDVPPSDVPCFSDDDCTVGLGPGFACPPPDPASPGAARICAPLGDVQCSITDGEPSQGDTCTKDCRIPAEGQPQPGMQQGGCAGGEGIRACTCVSGVFVQCACLPPERWPHPFGDVVPTAPYCDFLTGQPRYLHGDSCRTPGMQCQSTVEAGRGCVCTDGALSDTWACGDAATLMIDTATAPACESLGSGKHEVLHDDTCDTDWELCISRTYNATGTSPRGCICNLQNDGNWYCGSINRWFRAE